VRAAIIGFGQIAHGRSKNVRLPLTHLGAYQALRRRINLVAVADPSRSNLELATKLIPNIRVYQNHREMLAHERLDVVSIAVPMICMSTILKTYRAAECVEFGARNPSLPMPDNFAGSLHYRLNFPTYR
jgi:Oxidoreductase family, NAD-binding Rossmann fold